MAHRSNRSASTTATPIPFNTPPPTAPESSASGPLSKCSQVIFESVTKLLEVIILSRCPSVPSTPSDRTRFNLHTLALPNIRTVMQSHPLTAPILLTFTYTGVAGTAIPLEQYTIQYTTTPLTSTTVNASSDILAVLRLVCKRVILLLRTVHAVMRLNFAHNFTLLEQCLPNKSGGKMGSGSGDHRVTNKRPHPGNLHLLANDAGNISFSFSHPPFPHPSPGQSSQGVCAYQTHAFNPIPTPYGVLSVQCMSLTQMGFAGLVEGYLKQEKGIAGHVDPLPRFNVMEDYTQTTVGEKNCGSDGSGSSETDGPRSQMTSPPPASHLPPPHTAPSHGSYKRRHTISQDQEAEMSGLARALANDVQSGYGVPPEPPRPIYGQAMYPLHQAMPSQPTRSDVNNPSHTFAPPPPTLTRGYSRSLDHNGPSPLLQKMQGMALGQPPASLRPELPGTSPTPPLHPGLAGREAPDPAIFGYGYTDGFGNAIHQPQMPPQQHPPPSRPQSRAQSLSTSPLFAPSSPPFNVLSTSPGLLNLPPGSASNSRRYSYSDSASNSATSSATTTPNIFGVPGDVSGFLLPPSALDTLQDSPFKHQQQPAPMSHSSSIHAALNPSPSPSTMFGADGLAGLVGEEGSGEVDDVNPFGSVLDTGEASFLPFADVLDVQGEDSPVHSMQESASNFAKKCGSSQRLEMFKPKEGGGGSLDEYRRFAEDSIR